MTGQQVADLVNLLVSTWPTGVKGQVWTQLLHDHNPDAAVARASYAQLRDTATRPPSPAQFLEAIHANALLQRRARREAICGRCRGTGWIDCTDERRHGPGCAREEGRCFCHASDPCPACSSGHPVPDRQDPPMSRADYLDRAIARGDWQLAEKVGATASDSEGSETRSDDLERSRIPAHDSNPEASSEATPKGDPDG